MKAIAVFPKEKKVRMIDVPDPRIVVPTDVKLRTLHVGICGTDREICHFKYGIPPAGEDHLVIGHEMLAEVVEVGAGVRNLLPGDLVIPTVRRPCTHAHCTACQSGRQDFCYTGDFTERGIKQRHGYMTEHVVDEERFLVPVPADLAEVAVLVEPLTIAEKAIIQINMMQQRLPWACAATPGQRPAYCHTAVVLGAGPIGMLGAMALRANGYRTVVYSRELAPNAKSGLLEQIGAEYLSSQTVPPERLADAVGSIDVVYEAVGASNFAFDVIKALGTNGIFVFTGVPGRKEPIQVDGDTIMRGMVLRNQVVFGTVNAGRDSFLAAIEDLRFFMTRWPDVTRALISGRHGADRAADLLTGPVTGIKHVLEFAGVPAHA